MSNHERIYEGTLYWPLRPGTITCGAPAGESLPPWGLSSDDPEPENPCGAVIAPVQTDQHTDLWQLKEAIERHMREAHGEEV